MITSEEHEYFIFDALGSISGQFNVLVGVKRIHGLDEADCTNGSKVVDVHARIFKFAGNINNQAQITFNQGCSDRIISTFSFSTDHLLPHDSRVEAMFHYYLH